MKKKIALKQLQTQKPRPYFHTIHNLLIPKDCPQKGMTDLNLLLKILKLKPPNKSAIDTDIYGSSKRVLNSQTYQQHSQETMSDILNFIFTHKILSEDKNKQKIKLAFTDFYKNAKANCAQVLLSALKDLKTKVMAIYAESQSGKDGLLTQFSVLALLTLDDVIGHEITNITARETHVFGQADKGVDQHVVTSHRVDATTTLGINAALGVQSKEVLRPNSKQRDAGMQLAWNTLYNVRIYDNWCTALFERCGTSEIQRDILKVLHPDADFDGSKYVDVNGFINFDAILEIMQNHAKITAYHEKTSKAETSESKIIAGIYTDDVHLAEEGLSDPKLKIDDLKSILNDRLYMIDTGTGPTSISAINLIYSRRSRPIVTAILNEFNQRGGNIEFLFPTMDESKVRAFSFLSNNPESMLKLLTDPFEVETTIRTLTHYSRQGLTQVKTELIHQLITQHPQAIPQLLARLEVNKDSRELASVFSINNRADLDLFLVQASEMGLVHCVSILIKYKINTYDCISFSSALNGITCGKTLNNIRKKIETAKTSLKQSSKKSHLPWKSSSLQEKAVTTAISTAITELKSTMENHRQIFNIIYPKLLKKGSTIDLIELAEAALKVGNYGVILGILNTQSEDVVTNMTVFDMAMEAARLNKDTLAVELLTTQTGSEV